MTDNPYPDINPTVLRPGQRVVAMLDVDRTPLTVVRVEPLIVARTDDGREVTLFAHEVEPFTEEE